MSVIGLLFAHYMVVFQFIAILGIASIGIVVYNHFRKVRLIDSNKVLFTFLALIVLSFIYYGFIATTPWQYARFVINNFIFGNDIYGLTAAINPYILAQLPKDIALGNIYVIIRMILEVFFIYQIYKSGKLNNALIALYLSAVLITLVAIFSPSLQWAVGGIRYRI